MTRRPERLLILTALAAVALVGCTAGPAPSGSSAPQASGTSVPSLPAKLVTAAHLVSQEGLAIALASNVLQSQLLLVQDTLNGPPSGCTAIAGGGAHAVSGYSGDTSNASFTDTIYFDTGCSKPYMAMQSTVTSDENYNIAAKATVNYTGTGGADLGTMVTDATASLTDAGINLAGTGAYTRKGAQPVSLGLACQAASETALNCQGGVAQLFPALKVSLGSITPLALTLGSDPQNSALPFSGSGNSVASLAKGTLTVATDGTNLSLQGATTTAGDAVSSGQAGSFSLFPPTPTGWTVTDASGDVAFTINVVDDTTRALTGTITQPSTKKTLATLSVDQSGTGTITYKGQKPVAITSWTLAD